MQLMCPSCCGGFFSDPKGSVYMVSEVIIRGFAISEKVPLVIRWEREGEGSAIENRGPKINKSQSLNRGNFFKIHFSKKLNKNSEQARDEIPKTLITCLERV